MPRPNLLRIDDWLLRAAGWAGGLWLAGSFVWWVLSLQSPADGALDLRGTGWMVVAAASAPLGLLVAGLRVRRREHRAWALVRLIDAHVEIPAADLLRDSDFTAATLARAIRDLNNAGESFVVWDRASGQLQHGRLRGARVHVDECASCGAKLSLQVPLAGASALRCSWCEAPLVAERLMEEKARLVDALDGDEARRARDAANSGFSPVVFALLTLFFWPLGVGYALWHWQLSKRDT